MHKKYLFLFVFFQLSYFLFPQTGNVAKPSRKLTFYASWGYSRWAFTKSDIHFENSGTGDAMNPTHGSYDFTIYNAAAHDRPDFNLIASKGSDLMNFTVPQFSARIGFYFNNKKDEGWEINYDHAKYVVDDAQKMHIKGTILGKPVDKDTILQYPFFHFEHTDGANFLQVNYLKRWKFFTGKSGKNNIGWVLKPGAGVVVPRTDCTLFGSRINNRWHIAGFVAGIETGLRAELFNHLCVELTAKAAYTDYLWCYLQYQGNGNANHRFGTVGAIFSAGYQFHTRSRASKS